MWRLFVLISEHPKNFLVKEKSSIKLHPSGWSWRFFRKFFWFHYRTDIARAENKLSCVYTVRYICTYNNFITYYICNELNFRKNLIRWIDRKHIRKYNAFTISLIGVFYFKEWARKLLIIDSILILIYWLIVILIISPFSLSLSIHWFYSKGR